MPTLSPSDAVESAPVNASSPAPGTAPLTSSVKATYEQYVVPSYARSIVLVRGQGSYVWDETGKRYLDFGGGIAVNSLGHAHPAITKALTEQSQTLMHVSNLYYHPWQAQLAERLVKHVAAPAAAGAGKVFFCNSGAEANEMLYKAARKNGNATLAAEGKGAGTRYEVITANNSFHGRTLGGIAATGQDKIKKGFEPIIDGFRHVPFHDLAAIEAAISDKTAAVLIESIQGESGIHPVSAEYLLGLRELCDKHGLLLLMDAVQCGMFRTGKFLGYQRILEGHPRAAEFYADGISMAKSLGGGFPIGAVWLSDKIAAHFQPGTHGTTYGGTPLACAVALAVLDTIENEGLAEKIRRIGDGLKACIENDPDLMGNVFKEVRGFGGLLGLELRDRTTAEVVPALRAQGLLVIPSGDTAIRLLPALNINEREAQEALGILRFSL
ncbi:aspartate aminotransferase family protein [Verrucomicrobia bacterium LW23]|nr:aspartate aminotransferase family protein [Verrucomicrobia bacterium LW23]